ncbi:NAD(P)-dependent alcohol dehydrogenase [uncultured Tessaracoccus sp.]|uniref:NAD(P)-dependent alcohol dehydrogenase n=1 Tax=uncultured Tessaracoccus sp. TaxID=905023 RepID=UPI0025FF9CCE|nr:NAD(P)-dependent alcohol dehydrogenase [uncultured Tessaracoccus sp.]
MEVTAYAIDSADGRFEKTTITRREPGPTEVLFDIHYAGICHSDIHTARGEWGEALYPLVPGHEIAGVVREVGSEVTTFAVGDRVGVGCFVDSCGECEECRNHWENFCERRETVWTYNSIGRDGLPTAGGYSRAITVEQDYVLRIPDEIPLDKAAPILCAGITTYSPLKRWGAGPGKKVAVIGVGGLGHMAVQIAAAMGAEVTGIGRTLSKRDDAMAMGASDYVASTDPERMKALRGHFDIILTTVSDGLDLGLLLSLLRNRGVLVDVGLPEHPSTLNVAQLIGGNKVLTGSNIGGIAETQEVLDFCAEHGIAPWVEVIGGEDINRAYDDVVHSRVRYRYVIDTATFDA